MFPKEFSTTTHQHPLAAGIGRVALLIITLVFAGCAISPQQTAEWSERLPAERVFYVDKYEADPTNAAIQTQDDYLKWVKRFYLGWAMYPNGWEWLTRTTLEKTPDAEKKQQMANLLDELGILAGPEWAKNSKIRTINSSHLMTWGNVLKLAIKQGKQVDITEHILRDAHALLAREIEPDDIYFDRYFGDTPTIAAHDEDDPFDV